MRKTALADDSFDPRSLMSGIDLFGNPSLFNGRLSESCPGQCHRPDQSHCILSTVRCTRWFFQFLLRLSLNVLEYHLQSGDILFPVVLLSSFCVVHLIPDSIG